MDDGGMVDVGYVGVQSLIQSLVTHEAYAAGGGSARGDRGRDSWARQARRARVLKLGAMVGCGHIYMQLTARTIPEEALASGS